MPTDRLPNHPSKTDKQKKAELYKRIWKLRVKGYTQYKIVDHLAKEGVKISQMGISKILTKMTREYYNRFMADVKKVKDEQVVQLDHIYNEAMTAWRGSKETTKKMKLKRNLVGGDAGNAQRFMPGGEQTAESIDRDGDPRYLATAMKAKEDIRKILGADAPIKSESTIKGQIDGDGKDIPAAQSLTRSLIELGTIIAGRATETLVTSSDGDKSGSERMET